MQRRNGRLPGRSDWQRRHIIFRACDHPPTFQLHHARTTPRVREGIALRCVWKESGRKVYVFHPSFYGWPIFWRKTAQNADTRCKPCLLYRPFPRTRAKHLAGSTVHGRFLRLGNFLPQNCATQRNAPQIGLVSASSEKQTAQHREKLRKSSLGNYKSAALDQLSYAGARAEK